MEANKKLEVKDLRITFKTDHGLVQRNISNPRYADNITFMAESEEPLDESERGE